MHDDDDDDDDDDKLTAFPALLAWGPLYRFLNHSKRCSNTQEKI